MGYSDCKFSGTGAESPVNRCVHHHVFDLPVVVNMLHYSVFRVEMAAGYIGSHIVVFAKK